jgi:hypothetical protein
LTPTQSNTPWFLLIGLWKLEPGLSKLFTPLEGISEEISEGGRRRISERSLAPALGWSFEKGNIFLSNTTSLEI